MTLFSKGRRFTSSHHYIESTSSHTQVNKCFIEKTNAQSSDSKEILKALEIIEKKIDKLYQESLKLKDVENAFHNGDLRRCDTLP
ncbi:MAG: hypothetical protein Sylvanvirus16_9 [Sylvanvirus sp.]|uniref:Uncharacterized protein n=1 Tax=Sylvanvirus sp. TaxID=2487774 RepID=A0A3G5AII7_9VIRU|nr:MAG: hypothetical protein Sylvanvirus16_9 [Sylvanvirus sp.]